MKIQCLDNKGTTPNTFLCKINQHCILINCPLETCSIPSSSQQQANEQEEQQDDLQQQQGENDLIFILNNFSQQGKRSIDTQYSSLSTNLNACDQVQVFRIPDFSLIDIDSIDLILISNYNLMLGLPFLTEYMGYKGKIIATEPTLEYAKQRMEELVYYHGEKATKIDPIKSTHYSSLLQQEEEGEWKSIYTHQDVLSCIKKVQSVRYTEKVSLFSTLNIIGYSSGYCLGSTNWLLETSFKKIGFLSFSSIQPNLHPAPLDHDLFKQANVLVVGGIEDTQLSLSFERAKQKFLVTVGKTIQNKNNVIINSSSMGLIFDLIGDIDVYFRTIGKEIGSTEHYMTPIYIVNPIAEKSLKYANICGEWMNSDRHDLLYLPELPLTHGNLMQTGGVVTVQSFNDLTTKLKEPCIVFTGDSICLEKGSLSWFINYWQNTLSTCLFIDPSSPQYSKQDDSIITFMKLPLDTRLKLEDVPSLLHSYWLNNREEEKEEERHLLIPKIKGANLVKEEQEKDIHTKVYIYEAQEIIKINLNRNWEKVSVSEKVFRVTPYIYI